MPVTRSQGYFHSERGVWKLLSEIFNVCLPENVNILSRLVRLLRLVQTLNGSHYSLAISYSFACVSFAHYRNRPMPSLLTLNEKFVQFTNYAGRSLGRHFYSWIDSAKNLFFKLHLPFVLLRYIMLRTSSTNKVLFYHPKWILYHSGYKK